MARTKTSRDAFNILKKQAGKILTSLRREIGQKEKELSALKQDVQRLQLVVNGRAATVGGGGSSRVRLDWNMILKELPDTFSSKEVSLKSGKPMEQVYAGLNRWIKDRKVRKGKEGYQKVAAGRQ
jgi:hypothetical protein